jgi:hypothetical protein
VATTQADIASQLKAALAVSMPEMDTSVGTPMAKIADAVAATISYAYVDNQLQTYAYDIDSKTDADLDAFCQLFGIARLAAKRASGTVTFTRGSDNTDAVVFIPINFQVTSSTDTPVIFQTITGATMAVGITSVTVPIQAVDAGPSGNIGPNLINNLSSPIQGVATAVNVSATSGGIDQETDTALRARWKATVFRNMAGTEDMFLGIALNDADCFAANVVTATKLVREQIQVTSGAATSTVNDAKYVFGTPVSFGTDIDNGVVFVAGHDYVFNATIPPTVSVTNSAAIPDGTIAELEYQYTPVASRSDPSTAIVNRIDVWCAGSRAVSAQQSMVFKNTKTFAGSGAYNLSNFVRPDGTHPTSGNVFLPLAFGPILTMSPTIVVGSTTYGLATVANPLGTVTGGVTYAYQIVHDNTAFGWTPGSSFGLEWNAANLPANNAVFTVGSDGAYTYNEVPLSVQQEIDSWRLLQVLHNVPGVDNVRFLNGADWPGWSSGTSNSYQVGIQQLSTTGTVQTSYTDSTGRPHDVLFTDSQVPQFGASVYIQRAQNSFGSY